MKKYRRLILKYLRENGLYAVVWFGHIGVQFVISKNPKIETNIYDAIFEEFYDKYCTCESIEDKNYLAITYRYGEITWQSVYRKLKEHGRIK